VIRPVAARVDLGVSVLARPNHPARLSALFLATAAVCAVLATALYAGVWVARDITGDDAPAGVTLVPDASDIRAPEGLMIVVPVESKGQFRELTGFSPFVPTGLPRTTDAEPKFAVTPADEDGRRIGRVAFSARPGAEIEGITGPVVVLVQWPLAAGETPDETLKQITAGDARAVIAQLACRDLGMEMQLYFGPPAGDGETPVTPYMAEVARQLLASLREECA
jgi:hypothetical protein